MSKTVGRKAKKVIDAVWGNREGRRYIARAYSNDGPGWGIWDLKDSRWIEGKEIVRIDPETPQVLS